jgi:hypothetical protein
MYNKEDCKELLHSYSLRNDECDCIMYMGETDTCVISAIASCSIISKKVVLITFGISFVLCLISSVLLSNKYKKYLSIIRQEGEELNELETQNL